jgi:hypothetical protein
VSTTVSQNDDGTYNYVYSIRNDPKAREAIKVWSIGMPATDALLSASHPRWSSASRRAPGHENAPPGAVSMTPVMFTDWRDPEGSGIVPGQSVTSVTIRSAYRPGFTTLYARSDDDYDVPKDLPAAVSSQLEVMRTPQWRDRAVVVIGPRFPNDFSRDFVAQELKNGIDRLARQGSLAGTSPFVTAIKSALETVSGAGGAGIPLNSIVSLASTPLETDVANAISISLR